MSEQLQDASKKAIALLTHYSFDLGGLTSEQIVAKWSEQYEVNWFDLAVIESLYQGRYKAVSVTQILAFWQRRGEPLHHFTSDFERLVCNKLPHNLRTKYIPPSLTSQASTSELSPNSTAETQGSSVRLEILGSGIKHSDFYQKLKAFVDTTSKCVPAIPAQTSLKPQELKVIETQVPLPEPIIEESA